QIPAVNRAAVNDDLQRIGQIAKILMDFPLAQDVESAPVFRP
ncbi:MAG: 1-carboxybiuret hydrolase subunit AtzG-like, partial [Bryobacterales bacterium]|nr:1-carboxybiuret hydrolase subunit AtzG-like [Bryobacterales bacterium]